MGQISERELAIMIWRAPRSAIGFVDPSNPRSERIEVLRAAGAQDFATGMDELTRILERLHQA